MNHAEFLTACRDLLGRDHVLTERADTGTYLTDQRKRYVGNALAVLRPADAAQTAALVRLCVAHGVPMVPQGETRALPAARRPTPADIRS